MSQFTFKKDYYKIVTSLIAKLIGKPLPVTQLDSWSTSFVLHWHAVFDRRLSWCPSHQFQSYLQQVKYQCLASMRMRVLLYDICMQNLKK